MDCQEFGKNLDEWIDGELSDDVRAQMDAHAQSCEACRRERLAAEQLRSFLLHMDDSVAVPLPAQAAWRNAVRAESRRRRMKRIYSVVGAAAAICVLTLGVSTMLPRQMARTPMDTGTGVLLQSMDAAPRAYVEADGVSDDALLEASAAPVGRNAVISYHELKVVAEDSDTAYGYVCDIVAEYGGQIDREAEDTGGRKLYVMVPGEAAADFISAVCHIGSETEECALDVDSSAELVGVCVVISAK